MKLYFKTIRVFGTIFMLFPLFLGSCTKSELHAFKGTVLDVNNQPVVSARIQVFNTPEDWLTGLNVVTTLSSDLVGEYESAKVYEAGDYYLFIEKYDTSNWNIRDVEQGVYPTVTLPVEDFPHQIIEPNNMALLANTNWKLTNTLREFSVSGSDVKEWHSTWAGTNNCEKDNSLHFGKDLSMRVSEGSTICKGESRNILGSFIPPMIFTSYGCEQLLHTSQKVKAFEFKEWPEMADRNAEMYLSCDQSLGQLYVTYDQSVNTKRLLVYSRN